MDTAATIPSHAPAIGRRAPLALRGASTGRGASSLIDGGNLGVGDQPLKFANALHRAGKTREQKATEAARDFVAIALVQPTLKLLRESNHAAPPFAPNDAEKKFGAMLDAQRARSIVESSNFPLVGAVRDRMLGTYKPALPISPPGRDLPQIPEELRPPPRRFMSRPQEGPR